MQAKVTSQAHQRTPAVDWPFLRDCVWLQISVPLQQMAFALHFVLPGNLYQPIVYTDGVALALCLGGFFVYQKGKDTLSMSGSE